jgi:glycosyltransferase involved in cell wall biosynthesis
LALAAAERAGVRVKVVGDGPELARLRQRFTRATFLGRVSDRRLIELYARCRALIAPAIEEFGITMVEAHAAGRPVVAAGRGARWRSSMTVTPESCSRPAASTLWPKLCERPTGIASMLGG